MVFVTAVILAQRMGASVISIEILLYALDHQFMPNDGVTATTGLLLPHPHQDMPLSKEAEAAITPLGDIFGDVFSIPTDVLRAALLVAAQ